MSETGNPTRCACGAPSRPNQFYCKSCHAQHSRDYRSRRNALLESCLEKIKELSYQNPITKARFQCLYKTPHVVVRVSPFNPQGSFAGEITQYHPGDLVTVVARDNSALTATVSIFELESDTRSKLYEQPHGS